MVRRALIAGVTGQDGSYLAEFLLDQGYEVVGMLRRSSTVNFERIAHIQDRLTLVAGDLLDEVSIVQLLREHRPTEVYNLAAQSFVQTSWSQPVLTGETTALGVTRFLDAIRIVDPTIRFYQASSSEMFGKAQEVPQRETTPFYPRSPYGVAKVYGHWITVNYRESYGLHASSGMLFNHESLPGDCPVVVRRQGLVEVSSIGELVPHPDEAHGGLNRSYASDGGGLEVWDGERWALCTARSATWCERPLVRLEAGDGVLEATEQHVVLTSGGDRPAGELRVGDELLSAPPAPSPCAAVMTEEEARLLGLLVAVGESETSDELVVSPDDALLAEAARCWDAVTGGTVEKITREGSPALRLLGHRPWLRTARRQVLGPRGRRIPASVLHADPLGQEAFLEAYRRARAVSDPSASSVSCPPLLQAGLGWLAGPARVGAGARRPPNAVVHRVTRRPYRGWTFDLATESGRFAAGSGLVVVHNSPRRGLEFVTRKITHGVARIYHRLQDNLALGNLDAHRDWGFAGDYVRAMWLMLQQDHADDYVVATGQTHSVREFCQLAFAHAGLDYDDHVVVDERFMRPAEVDLLVGDPAKATRVLGWKPETTFEQLVTAMVDADLESVARQVR